jgi:hypothetical protein
MRTHAEKGYKKAQDQIAKIEAYQSKALGQSQSDPIEVPTASMGPAIHNDESDKTRKISKAELKQVFRRAFEEFEKHSEDEKVDSKTAILIQVAYFYPPQDCCPRDFVRQVLERLLSENANKKKINQVHSKHIVVKLPDEKWTAKFPGVKGSDGKKKTAKVVLDHLPMGTVAVVLKSAENACVLFGNNIEELPSQAPQEASSSSNDSSLPHRKRREPLNFTLATPAKMTAEEPKPTLPLHKVETAEDVRDVASLPGQNSSQLLNRFSLFNDPTILALMEEMKAEEAATKLAREEADKLNKQRSEVIKPALKLVKAEAAEVKGQLKQKWVETLRKEVESKKRERDLALQEQREAEEREQKKSAKIEQKRKEVSELKQELGDEGSLASLKK